MFIWDASRPKEMLTGGGFVGGVGSGAGVHRRVHGAATVKERRGYAY